MTNKQRFAFGHWVIKGGNKPKQTTTHAGGHQTPLCISYFLIPLCIFLFPSSHPAHQKLLFNIKGWIRGRGQQACTRIRTRWHSKNVSKPTRTSRVMDEWMEAGWIPYESMSESWKEKDRTKASCDHVKSRSTTCYVIPFFSFKVPPHTN